jgi:hypothetical protein
LGVCYEYGFGVPQDARIAVAYYERGSSHNDHEATNRLGLCFEFGIGLEIDLPRAAECYRLAADCGHAGAQNNFGVCLEHGLGVDIDLHAAVHYYEASSSQGHSDGSFHLGLCYHYGIGVEADLEAAAFYYERWSIGFSMGTSCNGFRCQRSLQRARWAWSRPFDSRDFSALMQIRPIVFDPLLLAMPFFETVGIEDCIVD